uniref:Protein phosphatase 1 regulatory subunit 21 n=1 Tax=Steinernema glaseri TaxID=37863 RepID=A0A1I7Z0E8_9BILA
MLCTRARGQKCERITALVPSRVKVIISEPMSTISSNADINSKYQRLAAEYAKLRAQVPVLKSAVIEEQTRNSHLQSEANEKDSRLRRLEGEFDELRARNDALVKTIEKLQESLASTDVLQPPKKGKKKSEMKHSKTFDHAAIDSGLLEQELSRKLAENAELHNEIFTLQEKHKSEIAIANHLIDEKKSDNTKLLEMIAKLQTRNEELMQQNDRLAVRQGKAPANRLSSPLSCLAGINVAEELIRAHVDSTFVELETDELKSIVMDFVKRLKNIVTGWINLLTTLGQRSQLYPCDISFEPLPSSIEQYSQSLIHASESFTGLVPVLDRFAENVVSYQDFRQVKDDVAELATTFAVVLQECSGKVLPLFDISIDTESRVQWCTANLDELNQKWRSHFIDMVALFKNTIELFDASNIDDLAADEVVRSLERLANCASVVAESFVKKIFVENRIPTASKKLKCVNDCVQQSFQTISRHCIDIHMLCNHHKQLLNRKLTANPMRRLSLKIPSTSATPKPSPKPANPFDDEEKEVDLETAETSTSADPDTSNGAEKEEEHRQRIVFYEAEIANAQKRLAVMETEKEQNQVDIALLKMKLESALADKVAASNNCTTIHRCEAEMKLLNTHYKDKISDLVNQLQIVRSRANYYQNECEIIKRHIEITVAEREKFREEAKNYAAKAVELNDDLETVRAGYEEQMRNMCDHLADMSARLADQTETISSLQAASNGVTNGNVRKLLLKK